MGAGCVNLRGGKKRQQRKVGREEEGSSSNRPRLAVRKFVLALRGTPVTNPMLYLCDNQAMLKSCLKMGRRRWKRGVSESTRRRYFTGSNQRAMEINNNRSSDITIFGQGESASTRRRTCKWGSRHSNREGCFEPLALMFPWNGTTGQIEQSAHGKCLTGRRCCQLWAMKIESRRGTAGCGMRLDEDQE